MSVPRALAGGALALILSATSASPAHAHPILLDEIEATASRATLALRITTTLRTVVVSLGLAPEPGTVVFRADRLRHAVPQHEPYLLSHLRLSVDGQRLRGTVRATTIVEPIMRPSLPEADLEKTHVVFELDYPVDAPPERPINVVFEQDLLREFEFEPGRPWDVTYATRLRRSESTPAERDARGVLTARAPLELTLPASGVAGPASEPWLDRGGIVLILIAAAALLLAAGLWARGRRHVSWRQ